jgi:4-amino-4-deoxy-L-arabinose transferase-like glycosyltransferase
MNRLYNGVATYAIYVFIGLAVLINFTGLFNTIMGPDAALYASISKTMVLKNDFVDLFYGGQDWLDKPHFPFWITALSFKIFGINTWAYKLPGILFSILGGWYTYLFASKLYNRKVGLWAILILLTAQHIVLSNNDMRAEPYLTGLIIAAVYHFYQCNISGSYIQLLLACLFTAFAIMTKGMFALIPIGGAIAGDLIAKKQWKNLLQIRGLVALILIGIFILPEIYCLYRQFDIHPEKIVFGKKNVSGVWFFFWDSQVGRFFNTGPIKGKGNLFFYMHTILWAFLPWSILLFVAIVSSIRKGLRLPRDQEWYCLSGSLLTFIFFSLSKFQLPYYLNIIFPFFAIVVAQYLYQLSSLKTTYRIALFQSLLACLFVCSPVFLQFFYKPEYISWIYISFCSLFIIAFYLLQLTRLDTVEKILYRTAIASFYLNVYLNLVFYPSLSRYQSGSEAAFWINKNDSNDLPVFTTQWSSPYIFYLKRKFYPTDTLLQNIPEKEFLLYLSDEQVNCLVHKGKKIWILKQMDNYPITRLNIKFLNSKKRSQVVTKMDIALVKQ